MCDSCEKTEFGCCIDLENAALGPNFDGCPAKNGTGGGYKDCTLTVRLSIASWVVVQIPSFSSFHRSTVAVRMV